MKISVTYRYKKSGISMRVTKAGDVNVSAPVGMSKKDVLAFIDEHRDWIDQATARMREAAEKRDSFYDGLPLVTAEQCADASRRLNALIPPLLMKYEAQMGVRCNGFSYTRAKTRWGSCNTRTGHLNFSAYLLLLPDWCIEHVVVHELAHLIVPNHSAEFYRVMDKHFPRWREARAETKRLCRREDDM